MVEPTGTYIAANIVRSSPHDRQARPLPPRQGSSYSRGFRCTSFVCVCVSVYTTDVFVLIFFFFLSRQHEWSKHGVCAISDAPYISNEFDYFNMSLVIKSKVNLMKRLESVKITPNNMVTLKRDILLDQLKSLFNVDVIIYCYLKHRTPAKLAEIRLCMNPSMEFINCPALNYTRLQQHAQQLSLLSSNNNYPKFLFHNYLCKNELLQWFFQSPNCLNHPTNANPVLLLSSNNAPCPKELIFPDFDLINN
ncbi:unnamed protein product [Schistosoma turkestanicum]|nr:unnamed protein product [Schistosoma turkestanicum]